MPEVVIKYKNKRSLEALMDFSKYFEFSVINPPKAGKKKAMDTNGVTIIAADSSVDTSELEAIFSDKQVDAKKLRNMAWQRRR